MVAMHLPLAPLGRVSGAKPARPQRRPPGGRRQIILIWTEATIHREDVGRVQIGGYARAISHVGSHAL
jgi:hypothetical protein